LRHADTDVASSFSTFQLLFYALRPGFIRSQTPTIWHGINFLSVLSFDYLLVHFFGRKPVIYLIMSSFFAGSLHPCAAHFIAEHYLMSGPVELADGNGTVQGLAQETTSYYGLLNWLCYNVSFFISHDVRAVLIDGLYLGWLSQRAP